MRTKLTRTPEGVVLALDTALCEALGVSVGSEVEISTDGDVLVITPIRDEDRRQKLERAVKHIDAKYAGVFRRLANS